GSLSCAWSGGGRRGGRSCNRGNGRRTGGALQQGAARIVDEPVEWKGLAGKVDLDLAEQLGIQLAVGLRINSDGRDFGDRGRVGCAAARRPASDRTRVIGIVAHGIIDGGLVGS